MIIEILLFLVIVISLLLYTNRKPANLPPGKWGWPIIGMLPGGKKYYVSLIKEYHEKFGGGIYSANLGTRIVVIITDFELTKKAFAMTEFIGRPDFYSVLTFGDNLGVSMTQGKRWHTNRVFALKNLREFGMGKSIMEQYIKEEIQHQVIEFSKNLGSPRKVDWDSYVGLFNLSWQLVAGTRFQNDDKEMHEFYRLNVENFEVLQTSLAYLDFYPWANYLPGYIKDKYFNAGVLRENKANLKKFIMRFVEEHKKTFNPENPRDLIDMYFVEQELTSNDKDLSFIQKDQNLVNIIVNFFNGSDVTASTLHWFINMMARHPDIQEKAQKEVDEFVPRDRLPEWEDKKNLPFVMACVYETSRIASVTAMGIPHATTDDVYFENYFIPKGAVVLGYIEEINKDPKYWKHPNKFYPEHFLNAKGDFDAANTAISSFSLGKRICPGKTLADMALFMFTATFLQKFTFTPADGVKITLESTNRSQFFNHPVNYELIVQKRF